MSEKKYSIFTIQGGLGKHIAATAVAQAIKNNHNDRELIVRKFALDNVNLTTSDGSTGGVTLKIQGLGGATRPCRWPTPRSAAA